jgi:ribonucleases P/MRP protein subunit RPP40
VLRRATKVIPGLKDLEYEQRLQKISIPSMMYRRVRGDLIEAYKYTHGIYKLDSNLLNLDTGSTTRGHSFKIVKQRCNTTLRQKFFTQRVVERWNKLPAQVAEAPTINTFKNRLDSLMKDYIHSIEEPPTQVSNVK